MPRMMFDIRMGLNSYDVIKLSKDDFKGKAIVLIEQEDTVYFIEEGKIVYEERTMGRKLNIDGISWRQIDRYNSYIADISKQVNDVIDYAKDAVGIITQKKSKTFGSSITNVAFEFGFTLEKGKTDASALIPLLYKGSFASSFPANILKENLIRDIRQEEDYAHVLVGLSNPMGIIPAMCPQLIDNPDYRKLIASLLSSSELSEEDLSKQEQPNKGKRTKFEDSPQSSPSRAINDEGEATIKLTISARDFYKEHKIGEGGYGVVFKGEWENIPVAIKELRTGKMPDKVLAEFKNEAFIMAQYRHPNIVQLYGICLEQPYSMIMEFLVNGSLFHWLHSSKRLEWPKKYKISKDVAVGLAYLHKQNIIHRDIKSLNVLLDQQLNAKLSDYGLAKIKTYSGNTTAAAGKKQNVGTTVWKAPELFKRGSSCSNASDVYSYGMLLWEIASHKIPFEDADSPEIAQSWIKDGEQETIPPDCPTAFAEIIKLCWNQLPEARPSIAAIVQKLTQLVKEPAVLLPEEDELSKFIEQHHSKLPSSVGHSATKTHDSIDNSELMPVESSLKSMPDALDKLTEDFPQQVNLRSRPASALLQFRPTTAFIISPRTESQILQFFKRVGYGEQDEAENMLKANSKLALAHGDLTDCSKRTWKEITAFQYAVLALDYHMWTMLLKYLEDTQIRAQLEELSNNAILNEDGWVIKSAWTNKWPAVGWTKLIEALDIYIKNYDPWTAEQCRTHWRQQVGGAQLILPAHVINEYSHPSRPFYPCPKWGNNEASLPRQGVSDWLIAENGKYNLGKDFAWTRADWGARNVVELARQFRRATQFYKREIRPRRSE